MTGKNNFFILFGRLLFGAGKAFSSTRDSTSWGPNRDAENNVSKFRSICGTIQRTLKNIVRPEIKIKFHEIMAVSTLMYGARFMDSPKAGCK